MAWIWNGFFSQIENVNFFKLIFLTKLEYANVVSHFGMKVNVKNISISNRSGGTWPWLPTHTEDRFAILPLLQLHPSFLSAPEPPSCLRWWWYAKLSGLLCPAEEVQGPSTRAWRGREGGQLAPTPSCSLCKTRTKKGLSEAPVGKIEWLPGSWKSQGAGYAEYCTFIPASSQPQQGVRCWFCSALGHYPRSPSPLCLCSVRWFLLFSFFRNEFSSSPMIIFSRTSVAHPSGERGLMLHQYSVSEGWSGSAD